MGTIVVSILQRTNLSITFEVDCALKASYIRRRFSYYNLFPFSISVCTGLTRRRHSQFHCSNASHSVINKNIRGIQHVTVILPFSLVLLYLLTYSFPIHSSLPPENITVFRCFQGVEKGCIGDEWVK